MRRGLSASIDLRARPRYAKGRKWSLKHAHPELVVEQSDEWGTFIAIENAALARHHVQAVHTAEELRLLADRFPRSIALHVARLDGEVAAGVVMYDTPVVAHAQYIGGMPGGREAGAVDVVLDTLIERYEATHRWFDFGISSEQGDRWLNTGLAAHKESFGARGTCYDQYELDVAAALPALLEPYADGDGSRRLV